MAKMCEWALVERAIHENNEQIKQRLAAANSAVTSLKSCLDSIQSGLDEIQETMDTVSAGATIDALDYEQYFDPAVVAAVKEEFNNG